MSQTKVEELVSWCRRDPNAGCKVIPASGTKARNDLDDLVMQRTIPEMQQVWRALARDRMTELENIQARYEYLVNDLRAALGPEIIGQLR